MLQTIMTCQSLHKKWEYKQNVYFFITYFDFVCYDVKLKSSAPFRILFSFKNLHISCVVKFKINFPTTWFHWCIVWRKFPTQKTINYNFPFVYLKWSSCVKQGIHRTIYQKWWLFCIRYMHASDRIPIILSSIEIPFLQ